MFVLHKQTVRGRKGKQIEHNLLRKTKKILGHTEVELLH